MRKFWFLFCFLSACAHQTSVKEPLFQAPQNQVQSAFSSDIERSIFYESDEFSVPQAFLAFLNQEGARLKANPKAALKIVGYTDDDGSSAYNLAVAQKRIDEVVKILKKSGARAQQLQTYAVGKEKSFCLNDVECKRKMRRVDVELVFY